MTIAPERVTTHELTLPQELVLMLLNEETGYFRQVVGWDLNCAIIGAVLAELSIRDRIDTDMESLKLLDTTPTENPVLDPILEKIAEEPVEHEVQYWIERLVFRAPAIVDQILNDLVELRILDYHDGEFWTLARRTWQTEVYAGTQEGTAVEFVKTRVSKAIFDKEIPSPRDVIIIALLNTCDVLRFIFQLDEDSEERIQTICRMELIGRSIAEAVANNFAGGLLQRSAFAKPIPTVPLRKLLLNPHLHTGNVAALFADLAQEHGPVFKISPPFSKPMIFLAGPRTNRWAHRHGRMYLRARDYFQDFERVYGASGFLPALDGADHFRLRKSLAPAYSRSRLDGRLDDLYHHVRAQMANWKVGDSFSAVKMCRRLAITELSQLIINVDSQDVVDGLIEYKERVLNVHVLKIMPKFMLHTPGMKRRERNARVLADRIQSSHTPAQRAGCPRDLADDLLSLHASDPQFLPESNLRFALSMALLAGVYAGDTLGFAVYAMASQPEFYDRIRSEADALFANGDPDREDLTASAIDVTRRFIMECMRLYAVVPMSIRNVMNACVVEGCELPVGERIHIASTASHFMEDIFPDPFSFDIDRYLPPRNEHLSPGYAPYGLGTHMCLGTRWMNLQVAVNLLMLAHYFTLEVSPANYKLRINPFPGLSPSKKLKFVIAEQRRKLPA